MSFSKFFVFCFAIFLLTGAPCALAQQCPPNSHARMVSIPGNLATAHCWCDAGFDNVGGVCVRVTPAVRPPAPAIVPPQND